MKRAVNAKLTVTQDHLRQVRADLKAMESLRLLVGIPDETTHRDADGPNNAEIGYMMEYGVPERNIPARAFLVPGIEKAWVALVGMFRRAARAALDAPAMPKQTLKQSLEAIGLYAANAVKRYMSTADYKPLSLTTLRARAERGRKGAQKEIKAREAGEEPSNVNARPLIDTGQLRNSVTAVVRPKDA